MIPDAAHLSEAKRAILQKYLRGDLPPASAGPQAIRRGPSGSPAPLSLGQEQLWLHSQLACDTPIDNESLTIRRTGPLDIAALKRSLNEIIRRHEAWRTTFATVNGEPVQVVHPACDIELPVTDLRKLPKAEREAEALRLATEDARQPFNFNRGPLLRARLVQLGDTDHRLYLALHQIIFDGISIFSVFFHELVALYKAFSNGMPLPLRELPIQYTDFALWQREWLQDDVLSTQVAYWKRQLADAPAALELPTDRPRPMTQTFRGAQQTFALSKGLTESLKALSRREGVTLFMTLLAAFKTLLYRYTGQEDILVGTVTTSRKRSEFERLLGFFLNTLVLRTNLSGDPSFVELLRRVREVTLESLSHDDVPIHRLVKELRPQRDPSRSPLFQVMFIIEPPLPTLEPGWTLNQMDVDTGMARVDLHLQLDERPEGITGRFRYNTDLFDAASIDRMRRHLERLLESVIASPEQRISMLPLVKETERLSLSEHYNLVGPTNPFIEFKKEDIEQSISTRFEQQVTQYSDHVAVRTREHQWTYRELNRRANQVAHTILESCDSKEDNIGLLLEHGAPMVAAILSVLKTGKTYVPLDPTYPTERLAYIVEDSLVGVILTNSGNLALAKTVSKGGMQLINMDEVDPNLPTSNPNLPIPPDRLAYILYTSGSTGRPKGVMQNHRNVLHHIRNYTNNLHLCSDDRLTLLSSYSFDAAVMDIFGALLNGAALYPMDIKEEEPSGLIARMIEEKVTVFHATPTVYRYLLAPLTGEEDLSAIRFVVLGGEEAQKKDIDSFKLHFSSQATFINGLGPTESTLALQYFADHKTEILGNIVPVGYPVEDTEILLLTQAGMPTEIFGEIAIRSEHLALGYWQQPKMTADAFLLDPEGGAKRIYRTGDMGRRLPDGSIAFIGRKDFQVKIRGFRVELGEIEAVLEQHPGIGNAVVLARADVVGEQRLVAYVVPRPQGAVGELRGFLKTKLPDYMVPSAFVFLDALPLTPNGKVDRKALPVPDQARPQLERTFAAARTPLEEALTKIWADVLGLKQVGIHDNFFELGGHSLLATQVVSRVRNTFHVSFPLRLIFQSPTIAGLSVEIAEALTKAIVVSDEAADMLSDLESLSDEEAERLLVQENALMVRR